MGLLLQRQVGSLLTGAAPPLCPHIHSSLREGGGPCSELLGRGRAPPGFPVGRALWDRLLMQSSRSVSALVVMHLVPLPGEPVGVGSPPVCSQAGNSRRREPPSLGAPLTACGPLLGVAGGTAQRVHAAMEGASQV